MRRFLTSLALAAMAAFPIAAAAQQGPPPPQHFTSAQRTQMRADMQQFRKEHEQFRDKILGAITPSHRQLLASIAGNLAVAEHPDYRAAVAQLDAALSPGEKSAIMAAAQHMRDQMRAQMQQMTANMPKPQHPWPHPSGAPGMHRHQPPTAGAILLGVASGHGVMMNWGHGPGGWNGGPGGGPPSQP